MKYIRNIVFCNFVGALAAVATALIIFSFWDETHERALSALLTDSSRVGFFLLFPIGLIYSAIIVTPIYLVLKDKYWFCAVLLFIVALAPSMLFYGSMYWDILAFSFGMAAFLSFAKVVLRK